MPDEITTGIPELTEEQNMAYDLRGFANTLRYYGTLDVYGGGQKRRWEERYGGISTTPENVEAKFAEAMQKYPDNLDLRHGKIEFLIWQRRWGEAEELLRESGMKIGEHDQFFEIDILIGSGRAEQVHGRIDVAFDEACAIVEKTDKDSEDYGKVVHEWRYIMLYKGKLLEETPEELIQWARELDEKYVGDNKLRETLLFHLKQAGCTDECERLLEKYLAEGERPIDWVVKLAEIKASKGDTPRAIELYKEVLEHWENIHRQQGDGEYKTFASLVKQTKAKILDLEKKFEEAEKLALEALAMQPGWGETVQVLADVRVARGDYEGAIKACREYIGKFDERGRFAFDDAIKTWEQYIKELEYSAKVFSGDFAGALEMRKSQPKGIGVWGDFENTEKARILKAYEKYRDEHIKQSTRAKLGNMSEQTAGMVALAQEQPTAGTMQKEQTVAAAAKKELISQ